MNIILISKDAYRKLEIHVEENKLYSIVEKIGYDGPGTSVDMVDLTKTEAVTLRNILNGLLGGPEC